MLVTNFSLVISPYTNVSYSYKYCHCGVFRTPVHYFQSLKLTWTDETVIKLHFYLWRKVLLQQAIPEHHYNYWQNEAL